MNTERIIELLDTLTAADLRRVKAKVDALSRLHAAWQTPDVPAHEPPASAKQREEWVNCGKASCKKCKPGQGGHGPYLYAYWTENGRTRKKYLGKKPT
jgi:hypothetical protein